MANQIPLSGATTASGGVLLPPEQGQILVKGLLLEAGTFSLAGDARTTNSRRTNFPIWLGQPTAGPVNEGGSKPVTGAEFDQGALNVKKFASIVLFTDEQIEDVQNGDLNVLVDSGVRKALAMAVDAHALGRDKGASITSVFDNTLGTSAASPIEVDLSKADGLQKAVSAAMGKLEGNGYGDPSEMAVLLGFGFQQTIRDARDTMGRPLYGGNGVDGIADPLYGLQRAFSTNLNSVVEAAGAGKVVAYVVHKPNIHVRIREDVSVAVSREATINDGTADRHLFQENLTAIRYELRPGLYVHDVDRAVVPIVNAV